MWSLPSVPGSCIPLCDSSSPLGLWPLHWGRIPEVGKWRDDSTTTRGLIELFSVGSIKISMVGIWAT
jgi:hypothetical protein